MKKKLRVVIIGTGNITGIAVRALQGREDLTLIGVRFALLHVSPVVIRSVNAPLRLLHSGRLTPNHTVPASMYLHGVMP
jgi:hypothetical protein